MSPATSSASVSNGTRQKKRTRATEEEEELSCAVPSENYWFDDGNIILRVESTLFRVHRGVLCRHSTGFNEMFPVPQAGKSAQQNMIEGCYVADLQGDKVEDWDRVLGVIYDLDRSRQNKFQIEMVESMVRLGMKYQFKGIFEEAMERIRRIVPTRLEDFHWNGNGLPVELFGDKTIPTFKLMGFLLEIGNLTVLPALFYVFTVYAKGTVAIFELCRLTGPPELYQSIGERMAIGREQILTACLEFHSSWTLKQLSDAVPEHISNNLPPCKHPSSCDGAKQEYLRRYLVHPQPCFALKSGSEVLESFSRGTLCKVCRDQIAITQDTGRKMMWDRLPSFFGLPPWDELHDY